MTPPDAPLTLHAEPVRPDWVDYNGHMNVAYYVLAFDHATDAFLDFAGLGQAYRDAGNASVFVVEAHVTYEREVGEGDPLAFETMVLGTDAKRIHLFHVMRHATGGWIAATNELMMIHIDMTTRSVASLPEAVQHRLAEVADAHAGLPRPPQSGRSISLNPRRAG